MSDELRRWKDLGGRWLEVSEEAAKLSQECIAQAAAAIDAGDPRAASAWAQASDRAAHAGAIGQDKAAIIDGRPTERKTQEIDLGAFIKELERRGAIKPGSINPALEAPDEEEEA